MSPLVFTMDGAAWRGVLTGPAPVADVSVLGTLPRLVDPSLGLTPRQQLFLAEQRTAAIVQANPVFIPNVPATHYVELRRATVGGEVRALADVAPALEVLHRALESQSVYVPEEVWRMDVRQRAIPVLFADTLAIMGEVRERWGVDGVDDPRTAPDGDILLGLQHAAGALFAQSDHALLDTLSPEHEATLRAIMQAEREGTFMLGLSTVLPAIGAAIALTESVAAEAQANAAAAVYAATCAEEEQLVAALAIPFDTVKMSTGLKNALINAIDPQYLGDVAQLSGKVYNMGYVRSLELEKIFSAKELPIETTLSPAVEAAFLARVGRIRDEWTRHPMLLQSVAELCGDDQGLHRELQKAGFASVWELVRATSLHLRLGLTQTMRTAIDRKLAQHQLRQHMWWLDDAGLHRAIRGESEPAPETPAEAITD